MSPSTPYVLPRAIFGAAWSLGAIVALVSGGVGALLIAVALPVLAVAAFAAVVGNARFAFIPDRGNAVAVAAVAFALVLIAGAVPPSPAPTPLLAPPSTTKTGPVATTTPEEIVAATAQPLTAATSSSGRATTTAKVTRTVSTRSRSTLTSEAPTSASATPLSTKPGCDPSYPSMCLPATGPDLDCHQIPQRRFPVREPDRHRFDPDNDGVGCE